MKFWEKIKFLVEIMQFFHIIIQLHYHYHQIKIQSPSEKSYPLKYKKKEIETDPFSNMFTNRNPKLNNNNRFTLKKPNNKNNRLYFSDNMDSEKSLINCIKNFKISNYKIVN